MKLGLFICCCLNFFVIVLEWLLLKDRMPSIHFGAAIFIIAQARLKNTDFTFW